MSSRHKMNIPDGPTDGTGDAKPAPVSKVPSLAVGDIVLYSILPRGSSDYTPPAREVPMIVTSINPNGSINGVAFSDDPYIGFQGASRVGNADEGPGANQWRRRP